MHLGPTRRSQSDSKHIDSCDGSFLNEVVKDIVKVIVKAEWKNGRPHKWILQLNKALLSLFNDNWKEEKMEVVKIHVISDEHCSAVVEITPPSTLNTLIKTKTATLKHDVTVQFFNDMESQDRHNREIAREVTAEGTTEMKADSSIVEPPGRTDPSTFTLPVNLYWYLSHAYRKEINQLEKEFGVTIDAEVSVSISAKSDNTKCDSVQKAVQRFTGLVQNNSESLDIIPISQVDMESDIVKEALHNIPNAEAKMMLNRSADTCLFFAPKQLTSVLQKRMNTSITSDVSSNRTSQDKSGTLKMDIKDTQTSVVMDETHWKLLRVAFKTQIVDIQNKYGVVFLFENDQGLIKVKSQSKGTLVNLETHALRALQHLYQKVVVSTITCAPNYAETVTQADSSTIEPPGRTDPSTFTLPVNLYWYLSHAYRKEINQLEKEFGVTIDAEVSVSFSAKSDNTKRDSVHKAVQRFTGLVQNNSESLDIIPISQVDTESDIVKEALHNIPNAEAKMMLNRSADTCLFFAPKQLTSVLQKQMNTSNTSDVSSNRTSQDKSGTLKMDIKDTQTSVVMDETHWKLLRVAFKTQIVDIQNKYGVEFHFENDQGLIKVKSQSKGTLVNLENHALRALQHLYQKVVVSTITCAPNYAETVTQADSSTVERPGRTDPSTFTLPVNLYWYLSHAYRKEINQLEEEFGVTIDAEVSVSISAKSDNTKRDSVHKAVQRFTGLVQNNSESLDIIPISQVDMESDIVKEALHNIPNAEAKMMLNRSADTCLFFAPKQLTSVLQKRMNTSNTSDVSSNRTSQDKSGTLKMEIKDTQTSVLMDETHWKLLRVAFKTQIVDIQNKYGVVFLFENDQGLIKVKPQSKGTLVNLETHALRALQHLYQKVVVSTITCAPNYAETVTQADSSTVERPGRTDPSTFTLPVNLYWYLSHAYRKEINQLEEEFGVTIDAEVSVSISAKSDNTKRDSVHKAVQRFTGLVQNNSESLDIIPISQVDMESDIVKEALHNIPNAEAKMMLNRSADTCLFFAPKQLTSVLQKRMNTSNMSDVSSNRTSQDKSGTLKMDIKDTQTSVVMDETHWKLLRVAFKTQIVDIQNKYGVEFHFKNDQGLIKVKSQSKGTLVNLETHALRALQHLYQKVVVSTITCAPNYAETVTQADSSTVERPGRSDPSTFTLPVNLYWYLSHAYRKEINQLEEEFGVTIDAEVSVSISAKSDNTKRDSVHKAVQRFTGLVQNNSESLDIIPISQVDMESDIVKEALHNIPNAEAKMMLNRSADTCLFFAPKQLTSVLQKRMNTSNMSDVSSNRTSQDKSGTLKMDIKDTQTSVVMDETHWKLLRVAFKTQIVDIQNKYGVEFHFENDQGLIKVKSQSKGTLVNLETHALRALQHLYQKVVVSTITCAPNYAEIVTQADSSTVERPGRTDPSTFTLPVNLYWYLSHAYRKEINQLEEEFGVTIDAEVSVSISAKSDNTKRDSVHKAVQRFTGLVQNNSESLDIIPISQVDMESDIVKEALHNIPNAEAKMMLNRSADTCLFFAPKQLTSVLQKRMNTSNVSDVSSNRTSQDKSGTLKMDIKDTQTSVVMDETHWKLLRVAFKTQIVDIQNKYGVVFLFENDQGLIKVKPQSKGTLVNLENHALRALQHLYQKVVVSTITCAPNYAETVTQSVKRLHSQLIWVDLSTKYRDHKFAGLPMHLLPAIADIENEIGKSVFDDGSKQSLGYSDYLAQRMAQQGVGAKGGAGGADLKDRTEADMSDFSSLQMKEAKGSAKDKGNVTSEEENCPICMDTFIDKIKLKCGHEYCKQCLDMSEKSMGKICPVCKKIFGRLIGNQPEGKMTYHETRDRLPGFPDYGTIVINYTIPSGIQTEKHPSPGQPYIGTRRTAYLPASKEGKHVLDLLKIAFNQKLVFTVGTSTITGAKNTVTWNDIFHKTNMHGGPVSYGYPDAVYLKRVQAELKAKGIE